MSEVETGTEVLLTSVGTVLLAIPVGSVLGVDLDSSVPEVDAATAFGEPPPSESRRVRIRGRIAPFDLVVAPGIRVRLLADETLQAVPPFLAGMAERCGLVGLVHLEDGLALFIDPSALEPGP